MKLKTNLSFTLISEERHCEDVSLARRPADIKVQPLRGFTLIELLVVIAILGILVGISVPSLVTFNRRQQLKNAAAEVKSALRFAANKAITSEIESSPTCPNPSSQEATRLRGWYAVFSNGDTQYTISGRCAKTWSGNNPTEWKPFGTKTFQLPQNVTFSSVSLSLVYILFSPVTTPVTFYDTLGNLDSGNPLPGVTQASISMGNSAGDPPVTVIVTQSGEIK